MKLLIIDTCGATGSVALVDAGLEPASVGMESLPGRTASERLVGTIKELSLRSGTSLQSLDAVVVVDGPGSFTGVRVGLSAAKGLCEALSLPLIAISRLAVLAHLADAAPGTHVHALMDAGRGEFYCGVYLDGVRLSEALRTHDELLAEIDHAALEVGEDVAGSSEPRIVVTCEKSVAESIPQLGPKLLSEPTAEDALPLALARMRTLDFDDPATIDANYLRRTDAELFAKPRPKAARESARDARAMTLAKLHLRKALASDLAAILALESAADQAPHWAPAAYTAILEGHDPHRCLVLAEHGGALAGFAVGLMHPVPRDPAGGIAELESVVVTAGARRVGIGRALCEAVCDWCRSLGATEIVLEVRAASAGAIALYAGLGFEQTGRRPHYYRDPDDDAVVMRLRLVPSHLSEEFKKP